MAAAARANELSVETRRAGDHTIVIVTGRATVGSSELAAPRYAVPNAVRIDKHSC